MTFASLAPTAAGPTEGHTAVGGALVHWRLGCTHGDNAAHISRIAREWVEDVVRERKLFPWPGIAAARPWTKPRFAAASDADFSISHSGDTLLVAVAVGTRVGADVEQAPFAAFDSPSLRRRMCTPGEAARASELDDESRRRYLARLWTAKEAVVKASGAGLATNFRDLPVPVSTHPAADDYEAHLAVWHEDSEPAIIRLTTDESPRPDR